MNFIVGVWLALVAQSMAGIVPPDVAARDAAAEQRRAPCMAKLAAHWPGGLRTAYRDYLTICMYNPKVPFN